jgi:hypothetical protein
VNSVTTLSATNLLTPINKKTQTRPKSAEGVTPILQRSVSPDHLIVSKSLDSNNAFDSKPKRESFSGFSPLALLSSPPIVMSKLAFDTSTQKQSNTFVSDKNTAKLLENFSEQSSSDSVSTSKKNSIDKNESDLVSVTTCSENTYLTTVSIRMSSRSSSSETTTHSTLSTEKNSNTTSPSMSETTKCLKQSSSSSNSTNSSSSSISTSVMSKSGKTTNQTTSNTNLSSKIVIKQSSSEKKCKKDSNRSSSSKSLNSGKGNSSK